MNNSMLVGHRTWVFENRPIISGAATVVGPEEGNGPLANDYDIIHEDMMLGQKSWEKAEHMLLEEAVKLACKQLGLPRSSCNSISAAISEPDHQQQLYGSHLRRPLYRHVRGLLHVDGVLGAGGLHRQLRRRGVCHVGDFQP